MRGYNLIHKWPKVSSLDLWVELFSPGMPAFLNKFPRYIQVDITSHSGESNHRRWFSWCESRMRLLIRGIEMPNVIFCHPITNCYHRKLSENDEEPNVEQMMSQETVEGKCNLPSSTYSSIVLRNGAALPAENFCSSFFMGLTFSNGLRTVDLTGTVQV